MNLPLLTRSVVLLDADHIAPLSAALPRWRARPPLDAQNRGQSCDAPPSPNTLAIDFDQLDSSRDGITGFSAATRSAAAAWPYEGRADEQWLRRVTNNVREYHGREPIRRMTVTSAGLIADTRGPKSVDPDELSLNVKR